MANGKLVELEPFVYVLAPLLGQRPLEPLLRRTGKERSEPMAERALATPGRRHRPVIVGARSRRETGSEPVFAVTGEGAETERAALRRLHGRCRGPQHLYQAWHQRFVLVGAEVADRQRDPALDRRSRIVRCLPGLIPFHERGTPEPPKDRLGQRYQRGLALARRKETAPLRDLLLERSPSILDE